MNAKQIIEKFGLIRDGYYQFGEDPQKEARDYVNSILESNKDAYWNPYLIDPPTYRYIKSKWKDRIKQDCIGFSMALPTPEVWYVAVDEFLNYVLEKCPDFKILSIVIKAGGVRFNLEGITEEIEKEMEEIEYILFDRKLLK